MGFIKDATGSFSLALVPLVALAAAGAWAIVWIGHEQAPIALREDKAGRLDMNFPNETSEYRAARKALLASEVALRRQMEAVAAQLGPCRPEAKCPPTTHSTAAGTGGGSTVIRMSELFRGGTR